ncbi:hypothetical protein CR513_54974, partial [Mucuna pruriens]
MGSPKSWMQNLWRNILRCSVLLGFPTVTCLRSVTMKSSLERYLIPRYEILRSVVRDGRNVSQASISLPDPCSSWKLIFLNPNHNKGRTFSVTEVAAKLIHLQCINEIREPQVEPYGGDALTLVLFANAENTLFPKLIFFRSIGVSNSDMPKILITNHNLEEELGKMSHPAL